jgi:hypothetical protein
VAEIKIQEKKRNLLPLILGALALLLLLGYCLTRDRGGAVADTTAATAAPDTVRAAGDAGTTGAAAAIGGGAAVADFVAFAGARDTAQETEANHQYTAGGVRRLAAALDELAAAGAGGSAAAAVDIRAYADSMRRSVDRLQQSAADDRHADDAKAAFSAAVSAMTAIDRARGRTRDVAPMRAIYGELDSARPLLPQLGTVQRFFEAARDGLQAMGAAR